MGWRQAFICPKWRAPPSPPGLMGLANALWCCSPFCSIWTETGKDSTPEAGVLCLVPHVCPWAALSCHTACSWNRRVEVNHLYIGINSAWSRWQRSKPTDILNPYPIGSELIMVAIVLLVGVSCLWGEGSQSLRTTDCSGQHGAWHKRESAGMPRGGFQTNTTVYCKFN